MTIKGVGPDPELTVYIYIYIYIVHDLPSFIVTPFLLFLSSILETISEQAGELHDHLRHISGTRSMLLKGGMDGGWRNGGGGRFSD